MPDTLGDTINGVGGKKSMTNTDLVDRQTYAAGDIVFSAGDQANCAFIVQEGLVEIIKDNGESFDVLASIPKGGIFGEMALIDEAPRMAGARMAESGILLVVNRSTFESKLNKTDPFIRTLLRIFVDTIRRLQGG